MLVRSTTIGSGAQQFWSEVHNQVRSTACSFGQKHNNRVRSTADLVRSTAVLVRSTTIGSGAQQFRSGAQQCTGQKGNAPSCREIPYSVTLFGECLGSSPSANDSSCYIQCLNCVY